MEKDKINAYITSQVEKGGNNLYTLLKVSSYLKQVVPGLNMDDIGELLKENSKFHQLVSEFYTKNQNQRQQGNFIIDLDETTLLILDTYSMLDDYYSCDNDVNIDDIQDNNFCLYLKEISQRPLLTREQEKNYLIKIQNGDMEARKYFLECNLRLVISIARRYLNRGMEFLDLIQFGNLGLIKTLENYDFNSGNKFSTYAYYWILRFIKHALAENGLVRRPAHVVEKIKLYHQAVASFKEEFDRSPTMEEISEKMNWEMSTTLGISDYVNHPSYGSIEQSFSYNNGNSFEEILIADELSVEDLYIRKELKDQLKKYMIGKLSEREIKVLELRFGLENGKVYTLEEVSKIFGVTRERIRQIENQALVKLRKPHHLVHLEDYRSMPMFKSNIWEEESPNSLSRKVTYSSSINWQIKKEEETKKKSKGTSIYQKFSGYSKESIDMVLSLLTKEELSLIKLDLGEDLQGLKESKLTSDERRHLNLVIIPKMIRMLKELEKQNSKNDAINYQKVKS